MDRESLYKRINERVDLMIEQGLLAEAKELYPYKHLKSLQTVGYQELFEYLDKRITLQEAIDAIKQNSRRYAKRQMTWFRSDPAWKIFAPDAIDEINNFIESKMK